MICYLYFFFFFFNRYCFVAALYLEHDVKSPSSSFFPYDIVEHNSNNNDIVLTFPLDSRYNNVGKVQRKWFCKSEQCVETTNM